MAAAKRVSCISLIGVSPVSVVDRKLPLTASTLPIKISGVSPIGVSSVFVIDCGLLPTVAAWQSFCLLHLAPLRPPLFHPLPPPPLLLHLLALLPLFLQLQPIIAFQLFSFKPLMLPSPLLLLATAIRRTSRPLACRPCLSPLLAIVNTPNVSSAGVLSVSAAASSSRYRQYAVPVDVSSSLSLLPFSPPPLCSRPPSPGWRRCHLR